ncbi:hypothetical protein COMNV_00892 [Commensalibacter sp. Nvir]|uniref:type II toxin-antitoxin system RelE family toxin n=1 Tax=Commensalibacter sp. Nvir TaxID=3069817 RepID=UPI002D5031A2|nr:hypothetical protein COMNV_00892 [Commensalibacter sp. Nvir]
MAWQINYSRSALNELKKLDKQDARRIINYLTLHVQPLENPKQLGKALTGNLKEFWRYRIGNYRVIAEVQEDKIIILILRVAHRKEVYKVKSLSS